ncbi:MAG: type IV pilus modification protein PilV [Marinobacter sp.]|uniref:type IV pilus modification protein PilV n=1 Tax=Marinobacter sp. TaxID=50741 RepID=UPI00299D925B|nr:type IV pilus modification protein PilV [Marinobacter sp.]MDX1757271.1 type IV pilus modification protein PilV [Marinobacter sp.]
MIKRNVDAMRGSRQRGFTLIEVLVALLVLLVGLLGVAGVQLLSLQQASNANLRSQVNLHAQEMAELIRANDGNALVAADVEDWEAKLARDVPTATATIQVNSGVATIKVDWNERQYGSESASQSYTLTARMEQ